MAPQTSQSGPAGPRKPGPFGGWRDRLDEVRALLGGCRACPVCCGADRLAGEAGDCGVGLAVPVTSAFGHFGEERPLSGHRGSGTIFFGGCNLRCVFCQNHDISQGPRLGQSGRDRLFAPPALAEVMVDLADQGVHNVNLVSPSHVGPQVFEALGLARDQGLRLPVVWNSGGYDDVGLLELLDGLVDIYMPDAKYWDAAVGQRLSGVADYPDVLRAALREMHRQVGDLELDDQGVAVRGLLVRHLVLPEGLAGTEGVLRFLAEDLSVHTYVNIMGQYHPAFRSHVDPRLGRAPTAAEMRQAYDLAQRFGLSRLDERPARRWWL